LYDKLYIHRLLLLKHAMQNPDSASLAGNLPSSLGSKTDKLVHWCHGAPGLVPMLCVAAAVYSDRREEYLNAARAAGELIHERGLLKKGVGICHGIR
jgi:hypothetical protein